MSKPKGRVHRDGRHVTQVIASVKGEIERRNGIALAKQRISEITKSVVTFDEIEDPLAHEPPRLVNFDYDRTGRLTLILDRDVTPGWVDTLRNHLGNYASVLSETAGDIPIQRQQGSYWRRTK